MKLKKEKSCGCIIIKNKKVLLVYEKNRNFWGFPKGHMEDGETEIETALREVKEEVGLDVEIDKERNVAYLSPNYIYIAKNIVYSGSKTNVAMTMVGGKVLYRNGEFFMGNKPEEIYEACENIAKKIGLK